MNIKFSSSFYLPKQPATSATMAMLSDVKNRFISMATSGYGGATILLISGFALGMFVSRAIDPRSSKKINFQNRWENLTRAGILALTVAGSLLGSLVSKINRQSSILFAALSMGVILGIHTQEYYNKNSDQKINDILNGNGSTWYAGDGISFSLRGYRGCFSYFNPTKLAQKILERLNSNREFKALDLSDTDLTDDNLEKLAQTGCFNNLQGLILSENPRLTGRGIAWLAGNGFAGLTSLDVGYNKHLVKTNLNEWIEKEGFKNLTGLNLAATDITESELEQMIEKASWFKQLKGLNLDWNENFKKFPSHILELTNLECHSVSEGERLSGGGIYFRDKGIFCRGCSNLTCTKELLQLALKGKVFGTLSECRFLNIKDLDQSLSLKRIYEIYGLPFEENDQN